MKLGAIGSSILLLLLKVNDPVLGKSLHERCANAIDLLLVFIGATLGLLLATLLAVDLVSRWAELLQDKSQLLVEAAAFAFALFLLAVSALCALGKLAGRLLLLVRAFIGVVVVLFLCGWYAFYKSGYDHI